jgi:hypothetical protein
MIIVTLMKAVRDIYIDAVELRRMLAKRYPGMLHE